MQKIVVSNVILNLNQLNCCKWETKKIYKYRHTRRREDEKYVIGIWWGESKRKGTLATRRRRSKNNIKMQLKETGYDSVYSTDIALDRDMLYAVVNTVMNTHNCFMR